MVVNGAVFTDLVLTTRGDGAFYFGQISIAGEGAIVGLGENSILSSWIASSFCFVADGLVPLSSGWSGNASNDGHVCFGCAL